jgi:sugar lactone lactonase YvrE
VTICGLGHPAGLAFDASGALWVSDDRAHTVVKYRASHLLGSGSPAPAVVIRSSGRSLASPIGLAFDESGSLWVANTGTDSVVAFAPGQLTTSGVHHPRVVLSAASGSLGIPVALAFDSDGGLWVMGGAGILEKFSPRTLSTSGAPAPAIRLMLKDHTLIWGMALWPVPARLPLGR